MVIFNKNSIQPLFEKLKKKNILRIFTCGSVDDGKSTLIGRLLYDSKNLSIDEEKNIKNIEKEKLKFEFSNILDGLIDEKEQKITIDVAYRYFSTKKKKIIIADTPGHEQYTRNMVTGASNCDLSIIIVNIKNGVTDQTKRHLYVCKLLQIKNIILIVNKMDLLNFNQTKFNELVKTIFNFTKDFDFNIINIIPASALYGDNLVKNSKHMKWFKGKSLYKTIDDFEPKIQLNSEFLLPVQFVNRPDSDFRGYSGKISSGSLKVGDKIFVYPTKESAQIKKIVTYDGPQKEAFYGQSITVMFDKDIDCVRGNLISSNQDLDSSDKFQTDLVWLDNNPMVLGKSYYLKIHTLNITVKIVKIKYKLNIANHNKLAAKSLFKNEIGKVEILTSQKINYKSFDKDKELGKFIVIDKESNFTIAAGMIEFSLRRTNNIFSYKTSLSKLDRSGMKNQKPKVFWMTGLSGSGKSTIANLLEKKLFILNKHTMLLDGDILRVGLNNDLGFSESDRIENIRRVCEISKLLVDAGLIVIVALISPYREERANVRNSFKKNEFVEIFVEASLEVVQKRDTKGLYKKAKQGLLKNFTGIDSPYEKPVNPDIHINTENLTPEESVDLIIRKYYNDS